jgi:hypothetical protein
MDPERGPLSKRALSQTVRALGDARLRPHVSLIVTAFGSSDATSGLNLMGATSTFAWGERIADQIKYGALGRLTADAIVVDSSMNVLDGSALSRCISLANAIRRLSGATMPTGVRWSAIPIVLLVSNEAITSLMPRQGWGNKITVIAKSQGWSTVYDRIVKAALAFSLELVEQMRSLGWELHYVRGRWIRVRAKRPSTKGGYRQSFESELYDGTADQWLRARSDALKRQLSMVGFDETVTLHDVLHLRRLIIDPDVTEPALQRLIEEAPYLLRAARMELIAKPRFVQESTGDEKYPDVVIHPPLEPAIAIAELKLPGARLIARRGKLIYQSAEVTAGVAQVREYAEVAVDPSHSSQMQALFGQPVAVSARSLVIGMSAGIDPDELNKVRSYIDDVDVRTWDSILDEAVTRYSRPAGETRPDLDSGVISC